MGAIAAIAYLAICGFLLMAQNRLMFFPSSTIETTPEQLGLPHQDVWIPVQVGNKVERMHAWWIPARGTERGVVLYLHGNGVNVGANVGQAERFHRLGFSVLLIDYRGYGLSQGGFPTETSLYQDAAAAWTYLTQTRQIQPAQIWLYGHSLGGAIAIELATHHPDAAGLIVQGSFTRMRAMVDHVGQFWLFPIDLILQHRFESIGKVRSLRLPVLYVHGTADSVVPSQMSRELFHASSQPKQLYLVEGADHHDVGEVGGVAYLRTLDQFMSQFGSQATVKQSPPTESQR